MREKADNNTNMPACPDALNGYRLDRSALSVGTLDDNEERDYWHRQTPDERMRALEFLRQVHYGYDPTTCRLQRVLEVVELGAL